MGFYTDSNKDQENAVWNKFNNIAKSSKPPVQPPAFENPVSIQL